MTLDMTEHEGKPLPLPHWDGHFPGFAWDCPGCMAECWCSHYPGVEECVFCADLKEKARAENG